MQITVVGVKFKENGKLYYFAPQDFDLKIGDGVIVETANGEEYALVSAKIKQVDESSIVMPLKKVVRKATEKDKKKHEQNLEKAKTALKTTQELVDKLKLDMQLVETEYIFDGSKVIISITSDNRVDFRELVKELASKLKARIELRQIGIRDKSKTVGGIGICGRECCCNIYLNDFEKVSIKMAKTQNLSLNPTKISGLCGRLMCCLEYENPYYQEVVSKMPKLNSEVNTPEGKGQVVYTNVLKQTVSVKLDHGEGSFAMKDFALQDIKIIPKENKPQPKQEKPSKDNKDKK